MFHRTLPIEIKLLKRDADDDDDEKKKKEEEDDQRADNQDDGDEKKADEKGEDEEKRSDDEVAKEKDSKKDDEIRTDKTFTSGAAVTREDNDGPYQEVLGLDDSHIRLGYFASGNAPVLDSHRGDSLNSVLGVVSRVWLDDTPEGRMGKASIRFSQREGVQEIVRDIQNGIIRNCSVGYRVYRFEDSEDTKVDLVAQERKRGLEIREAVRLASLDSSLADSLVEKGTSVDQARKIILETLAERSKAQAQTSVIMPGSYDEKEVMQRGIVEALLTRHDSKKYAPTDAGKKFQYLTLTEMAKTALGLRHERIAPNDVITRSFQSTSDFPMLLSNFMGRLLRDGFQAVPQTWRTWTRQSIARDFRPQFRIMLSDAAKVIFSIAFPLLGGLSPSKIYGPFHGAPKFGLLKITIPVVLCSYSL